MTCSASRKDCTRSCSQTGDFVQPCPTWPARFPSSVMTDVPLGRLEASVETALWYLCAEAVTNSVKHSGATRATIHIERLADEVVASISDDGGCAGRPCGRRHPRHGADGRPRPHRCPRRRSRRARPVRDGLTLVARLPC